MKEKEVWIYSSVRKHVTFAKSWCIAIFSQNIAMVTQSGSWFANSYISRFYNVFNKLVTIYKNNFFQIIELKNFLW